jgi:hypothetical protein
VDHKATCFPALLLATLLSYSAPGVAQAVPALDAPDFGPTIVIEATVDPNLQVIQGTVQLMGEGPGRLIDALSIMPTPTVDRISQRTFPSMAETGWIRLRETDVPGAQQTFTSILPRRFGASGMVSGRGLYMNGLWHPQPVVGDQLAIAKWIVLLHLPPDMTGVVNGQIGRGMVRWTGDAERVAIAVIPNARVQTFEMPSGVLKWVDSGPRRKRRDKRIAIIAAQISTKSPGDLVLVEAPLLRRIVRPAPSMTFISDRATRVTGRFWKYHQAAIQRGILASHLANVDPWARGLAAQLTMDLEPKTKTAVDDLKWIAWLPVIDALLYDGSLPYMGEIMGEVWPSDPVSDDLLEVVDKPTPSTVVARKITGRYGESAALIMSKHLADGDSLEQAATRANIPPSWLQSWRQYPKPQNLRVRSAKRQDGRRSVEIVRDSSPTAPPEPISYRVGDEYRTWQTGEGPGSMGFVSPDGGVRVIVDPQGEVLQTRRDDDASPREWRPTFAAGIYEVNVNQLRPSGAARVNLRRRYDTRWNYGAHIGTNPINLISSNLSLSHGLGPLNDRRNRSVRVSLNPGFSWLDPEFRPTNGSGQFAAQLALVGRWETRHGGALPRKGHQIGGGVEIGTILQSEQRWGALHTSATKLLSVAPWMTLASRLGGGLAQGGVRHRMIPLGGSDAIQGLPANASMNDLAAVSAIDLRITPIEHASIPVPLAWVSHLQLSGGLDAGMGNRNGQTNQAVGWVAGLAVLADVLGARPTLAGLWFAKTISPWTTVPQDTSWPQVYLRFFQPY